MLKRVRVSMAPNFPDLFYLVSFGDGGRGAKTGFDADVIVDLDLSVAEVDFVAGPLGEGHDFAVVLLHGVVDEAGEE